jgi:transposase InsO family protein
VFESVTTFGDSGTLDLSSILMKNNILNFLLKGGKYKEKLKYQPIITTGPTNRVGIMPVGITTVGIAPVGIMPVGIAPVGIMPWNRRFEPDDGRATFLQIVMPHGLRQSFNDVHGGTVGGHFGRKRTEAVVRHRAYWPGWTSDIADALRRCAPCAQYHRGASPKRAQLRPFLALEPWETISIDITGPYSRSINGHIFILTVQNHLTKWAEAIPIRNHTAPTGARALFDIVLGRMKMPLRLLSDQGSEFEGQLFQELYRHMGITKVRTTLYHPATNGRIERFHRILNSMIAKVVVDNQKDWCRVVAGVMTAYRATLMKQLDTRRTSSCLDARTLCL